MKKMKGLLMRAVSLTLAMLLILSDGHLITVAQANTATLYMATEGLAATALAASDEIILTPDFDPDGEVILPDVIFAEDGDIPGFDPAHPSESPIPDGFPAEPGELPALDVDLGRDTEILDSTPAEAGDIPTLDYVNEAEGEPADSDEPDLEYSLGNYEDLPESFPAEEDDDPTLEYTILDEKEDEVSDADIPDDVNMQIVEPLFEDIGMARFSMPTWTYAEPGELPYLMPSPECAEVPEVRIAPPGHLPAFDAVDSMAPDFTFDDSFFSDSDFFSPETTTGPAISPIYDPRIRAVAATRVTITFTGGGGASGTPPANIIVNTPGSASLSSRGTLSRTGHVFGGWRDAGGFLLQPGTILNFPAGATGTITLTAHWIPNRVTVQYRSIGHTSGNTPTSILVSTPGYATMRPQGTLLRHNHAFGGWRDSSTGRIFPANTTVTWPNVTSGTIGFYAHWIPNVVTIQYNGNGHTGGNPPSNQNVSTPGSVNLRAPGNMTRVGHSFGGWRDSTGRITQAGQPLSWSTIVSGTVTLTAHWIPNVVTIEYRSNGHNRGTIPANQTVITPGSINLMPQGTLAKPGHSFGGWRDPSGRVFPAGQLVTWSNMASGTLTLDAHWIPNVVTIQYRGTGRTGGIVPASQTLVTPGSIELRPQGTLARTGYAFGGWRDPSGRVFPAGQTVTWHNMASGTVIMEAHWIPNVVRIEYRSFGHTTGREPSTSSISTPGSVVMPGQGTLRREGHTLRGWIDSSGTLFPVGQRITFPDIRSGTIILTADWVPNVVTIQYRSQFLSSLIPADQTFTTPGHVTLSPANGFGRSGSYSFGGWRNSLGRIFRPGETIHWPNMASGTMILHAHWQPNVVSVQFTGNGNTSGTRPGNQTVLTPGDLTLPSQGNLLKTDHVFEGWMDPFGRVFQPGQTIRWPNMVNGTVIFRAHWVPNRVTINYVSVGHTSGAAPVRQGVSTPGFHTIQNQRTLLKTGYVFGGWQDSSGNVFQPNDRVHFPSRRSGAITLMAVWQRPGTATIAYNGNGATRGMNPGGHTIETPGSIVLRNSGLLSREGHTFAGWRLSTTGQVFQPGQTVNFSTGGTFRFDAVWEAQCTETWYTFTVRDGNRDVEVYVLADMSRAVTRQAGSSLGTELRLIGNSWVQRGNLSFAPGGIAPADGSIAPRMAPPMFIPMMTINIDQAKNAAIAVIRGEFLDTFGFTPNMLTAEDMRMITLGISNSIDDNLFFGLAQWITRPNNHNDNYFYLKAKTTTTTLFIAHFGAVAGVSAVNAVNALRVAGASGKFALMTAPTGGGAAAGGVVAVGALVTAAGSAAVSVSAVLMMDRSVDLLGRDFSHLNTIRPPEHIDFAEEIIQETRDAIANNHDPSRTANVTSRFRLTQTEALDLGDRIMGSGYREVGNPGSGVFHKLVGNEIYSFRIDRTSLIGNHSPNFTHVHFEIFNQVGGNAVGRAIGNNHIIVIP